MTGLPPPCVEDGTAIPVPFVHLIDRTQDDAIQIVERVAFRNFVGRHQFRGRPRPALDHLVAP